MRGGLTPDRPPGLVSFTLRSGRVVVRARSTIHDTTTTWPKLGGSFQLDLAPLPADLGSATATIKADMRDFDAGDRLKNWKLRDLIAPDKHPEAEFTLERLENVRAAGGDRFQAVAVGTLRWRGRTVAVRAEGTGRVTRETVDAEATFTIDVRQLGMTPPKFFLFKMDNDVLVTVTLSATASAG